MTTVSLFGTAEAPFDLDTARAEFTAGGTEALRTYLLRFFAKTKAPIGFALHEPGRTVTTCKPAELGHLLGGPRLKFTRRPADAKTDEFAYPKAIVEAFKLSICTVDTAKPRVYEEKGQTCINLFGGWLYEDTKEAPSADEQKMIKPYLEHIRIVWANNNDVVYQFLIRWFARVAQKGKNMVGLLLISAQGTGKSFILELIRDVVFGHEAVHITDQPGVVIGEFNSPILGKALLVLEEMSTPTNGQHRELTNKLKMICTGATIQVTKKHQEAITVRNCLNVLACANRYGMLALTPDDRRWAMLDISDCKRNDHKYFERLLDKTPEEKKTIGFGLWKFFRSVDLKGHTDNFPPATKSRAQHTIPPLAEYLKDTFLTSSRGIEKQPYSNMYAKYCTHLSENKKKEPTKVAFTAMLKSVGIETKQMRFNGSTPKMGVPEVSFKQLFSFFSDRGWIIPEDDIENPNAPAAAAPAPVPEKKAVPAPAPNAHRITIKLKPAEPEATPKPQWTPQQRVSEDLLALYEDEE